MSALSPSDARRAALSAGLLSSNHDGEVIVAARALCGLLRKIGLDPASVVSAGLSTIGRSAPQLPQPRESAVSQSSWQQRVRTACFSPRLNDWERRFLTDILAQSDLSQRQERKMKLILRKSEGPKS